MRYYHSDVIVWFGICVWSDKTCAHTPTYTRILHQEAVVLHLARVAICFWHIQGQPALSGTSFCVVLERSIKSLFKYNELKKTFSSQLLMKIYFLGLTNQEQREEWWLLHFGFQQDYTESNKEAFSWNLVVQQSINRKREVFVCFKMTFIKLPWLTLIEDLLLSHSFTYPFF